MIVCAHAQGCTYARTDTHKEKFSVFTPGNASNKSTCRITIALHPLLGATEQAHERELGSIQPINSFGPSSGGGKGGGGGQGSIVDKASARDLLRADVSPMEIDSSVTFDSIGGGKVC